ncbi:hypothetical protein AVEN_108875-1 [Araneus ventricosus]|uniref:DNA-directed DNA polymerase n=1 Tax=Araneus ventricosus TaxID=182803 RepID=A0A4Y2TNY8_ARAVE|nr:hypothetical protein AVEN_108875-1 [Araneus ventricosus]
MWSVLSALHPVEQDAQRVSKYKAYENELNFKDIEFPVKMEDRVFKRFENLNNVSVNIYSYEEQTKNKDKQSENGDKQTTNKDKQTENKDKQTENKDKQTENENIYIYPLRITENKVDKHVNLLYIKNKDGNNHYCWVKDMSKLISSQLSDHNGKIYPCDRCLVFYHSEKDLQAHEKDCKKNKAVKIAMPKNETIKFKNYHKSLRTPFVMYADFECLTTKTDTCQPDENGSYMQKYQKHETMSSALYIKYKHDDYKPPITYRGPNATKVFYAKMKSEALKIKKIYDKKHPIKMTAEDEKHFQRTNTCHICELNIKSVPSPYSVGKNKDFEKVRDPDHLIDPSKCESNYRGPAHSLCDLMYQNPSFVPMFIHNLSGYDSHLFIKELGRDKGHIYVIPNTDEKYISFSKEVSDDIAFIKDGKKDKVPKIKLRFVDSFQFMASSLESLAKNVKEFRETAIYFPKEKLDLVTRKGVYPYDYMDSWGKCEETKLPSIKEFYNKMNESNISHKDYKHAKNVWRGFDIKNLGEYSDLYVKTDVLILADVIEHFRDVCIKTYKLDPAWYFTAPGLSWDEC